LNSLADGSNPLISSEPPATLAERARVSADAGGGGEIVLESEPLLDLERLLNANSNEGREKGEQVMSLNSVQAISCLISLSVQRTRASHPHTTCLLYTVMLGRQQIALWIVCADLSIFISFQNENMISRRILYSASVLGMLGVWLVYTALSFQKSATRCVQGIKLFGLILSAFCSGIVLRNVLHRESQSQERQQQVVSVQDIRETLRSLVQALLLMALFVRETFHWNGYSVFSRLEHESCLLIGRKSYEEESLDNEHVFFLLQKKYTIQASFGLPPSCAAKIFARCFLNSASVPKMTSQ
jgi:hypothetical protein